MAWRCPQRRRQPAWIVTRARATSTSCWSTCTLQLMVSMLIVLMMVDWVTACALVRLGRRALRALRRVALSSFVLARKEARRPLSAK